MSAILTLNAGSSSIKFGLFDAQSLTEEAGGQVERIGGDTELDLEIPGEPKLERRIPAANHQEAVTAILAAIAPYLGGREVVGMGHRVVHGGPDHGAPLVLDDAAISALTALEPLAPLHQPHNLSAVRAARRAFPDTLQVACFDTAFHRGHPWVNDTYGLPRRFYDMGVRRYGFHGLSYAYIAGKLAEDWPALHEGRVVVAHLGNGASLCAMEGGRSVASTMGFSALSGLCMGTRPGQMDPGVLLWMLDDQGMSSAEITQVLYKESGLKGLSGMTNDMRALLGSEAPEAAQAVDYFVDRVAQEVAAMAAAMGGIDALVFTGGIGENAAPIRARVLEQLAFLGFTLDARANEDGGTRISSGLPALVLPTNEELVIARAVQAAL
ncbi:acetate/propionate family kinase [Vannielia litorea]|uniref:acetate/propionate family kinase n=1 Tax=Vannielia litorea TaxID=1217970 RepID=UPI001C962090|nr:acetate/propionate family kinase [Vannielia litorea]MBY6046758.1 acetate/propionate family kinase [Vannielia litorea]MBY6074172.1 acetate/propionate family kinase [Vannielia litorea]